MEAKKILTVCVPVVLAVFYMAFFILLSMDVFSMNGTVWQKIGGFIMENVPTILLAIALYLAWKKPTMGGVAFILLSIIFTVFFNTYHRWDTFVLISAPLLVIGGLFLLSRDEYNRKS
jgi:UDP-N-acetylmuramyl pentapeptide phosphotransferase/UDP-N-acetylglucosamine-1-phosphate transferase